MFHYIFPVILFLDRQPTLLSTHFPANISTGRCIENFIFFKLHQNQYYIFRTILSQYVHRHGLDNHTTFVPDFNKKYNFLKSSAGQGLVWCFWHTLLWVVDSEFTDWRAVPYIISNIVMITSITVLMNIFLERSNNLIYSVLLHFGFHIIYVLLDANIGFFVILTILYNHSNCCTYT